MGRHTEGERKRHRERQKGRDTDGETETKGETETERERHRKSYCRKMRLGHPTRVYETERRLLIKCI